MIASTDFPLPVASLTPGSTSAGALNGCSGPFYSSRLDHLRGQPFPDDAAEAALRVVVGHGLVALVHVRERVVVVGDHPLSKVRQHALGNGAQGLKTNSPSARQAALVSCTCGATGFLGHLVQASVGQGKGRCSGALNMTQGATDDFRPHPSVFDERPSRHDARHV